MAEVGDVCLASALPTTSLSHGRRCFVGSTASLANGIVATVNMPDPQCRLDFSGLAIFISSNWSGM